MPTRKSGNKQAKKSKTNDEKVSTLPIKQPCLDNEEIQCCYYTQECPLQTRQVLKTRLCKHHNNFYLDDFLQDQYNQLQSIVKECVEIGESNSVLVIGPRGSGKSKLIEKVLANAKERFSDNYFCIRLSGLIHTDDRSALQDMARQLELENVVSDKVFGSFADNLAFILDALKDDHEKSKSIVIVVDEFDMFTEHKNQSLLYNLFDITMSRQTPLCVVGITCRLDVVELLEKRVKSRYSHRSVLTFPAYKFSDYLSIARQLLCLTNNLIDCPIYTERWNRHVKDLLEQSKVTDILEQHFRITKAIGAIVQLLTIAMSRLTSQHRFLTVEDIDHAYTKIFADSKSLIMNGLSILELCLIVAAKHVLERREGQPFNFEMIFNEYETFAKCRTGVQYCTKAVSMKAFEHLTALELIRSTETMNSSSVLAKEFKPMTLYVDAVQIRATLRAYTGCPTELLNWVDYMHA